MQFLKCGGVFRPLILVDAVLGARPRLEVGSQTGPREVFRLLPEIVSRLSLKPACRPTTLR